MRVLLVEPPTDFWFVMGEYLPPPFGIIQLAAYIERELIDVEIEILDCTTQKIGWRELERDIEAFNPELVASSAFASDGSAQAAGLWIFFGIAIAVAFVLGVAALGCGLGMGNAIRGALEGTARNPEAGGKIMTTMIIGLALVEALCIYAFVIALIMYLNLPDFDQFVELVMH